MTLTCHEVDVVYRTPTGEVDALVGVSATFPPGAVTVVAGPSGSGKSSLLRLLAALERPALGDVLLDDLEIGRASRRTRRGLRRSHLAYVGSHTRGALTPGSTVDEELQLVAAVRGIDGWNDTASARLTAVGLAGRGHEHAVALSGGEQQRAAVVAALVGEPPVLLADEPTAALDSATAELLLAELRAAAARGTTVVIASHDPIVIGGADRTVSLRSGRVVR